MRGKVYLVGAGPGDWRLITVRGLELLQAADAVVYDRLADEGLLALAKDDAELLYVGKAAGDHALPQEEINRLLAGRAAAGKTVVRLKGGDPFVFGRGGEEALYLAQQGIPFEIVPGVTSAVAVPAYAGIPVTHRGVAASFAVITGHEDPGKAASAINWPGLARGLDTLVFLMGVENIEFITEQLIKNGRPPGTPAAAIRWGARPEQEVLTGTVANIAQKVRGRGLKPPAVLIVGEVVRLREDLAWYDTKPLFGRTVLVTRAREQASLLAAELEDRGARVLAAPVIKIAAPEDYGPLDASIGSLPAYQWVIFTSANGVDAFFRRLAAHRLDARALGGARVAAIGVPTAERLRSFGIIADIVPAEFRAEGIVAALDGLVGPGDRVLIPRAAAARDVLPVKLAEAGAAVDVVPAYRTVPGEAQREAVARELAAGRVDIVTFTSSSTVVNLLELLGPEGKELLSRTTVACIGPITAGTCFDHGIEPRIIAEEFTIKGLVEAIEQYFAASVAENGREGKVL